MTVTASYDLLIIGGGQQAAELLKQLPENIGKVAVIDSRSGFPPVTVKASRNLELGKTTLDLVEAAPIIDLRRTPEGDYLAKSHHDKYFQAPRVWVAAGATTLKLAHKMGYGLDYLVFPLKGFGFQVEDKLAEVRYFTFRLDEQKASSVLDFFRLLRLERRLLAVLRCLISNKLTRRAMLAGFGYRLPWLKDQLLKRQVQKLASSEVPDDALEILGPLPLQRLLVDTKTNRVYEESFQLSASESLSFFFPGSSLGSY